MKAEDVEDILEEFLKDYLVDPISNRKTKWIYGNAFKAEFAKNGLPRVLISRQPANKNLAGINTVRTIDNLPFEIQVKANTAREYIIDGKKVDTGGIVNKVGNQIEELIKQNHEYFTLKGLLAVTVTAEREEEDFEKNESYILTINVLYIN